MSYSVTLTDADRLSLCLDLVRTAKSQLGLMKVLVKSPRVAQLAEGFANALAEFDAAIEIRQALLRKGQDPWIDAIEVEPGPMVFICSRCHAVFSQFTHFVEHVNTAHKGENVL